MLGRLLMITPPLLVMDVQQVSEEVIETVMYGLSRDDGNAANGDGCSQTCKKEELCWSLIHQQGERFLNQYRWYVSYLM